MLNLSLWMTNFRYNVILGGEDSTNNNTKIMNRREET